MRDLVNALLVSIEKGDLKSYVEVGRDIRLNCELDYEKCPETLDILKIELDKKRENNPDESHLIRLIMSDIQLYYIGKRKDEK